MVANSAVNHTPVLLQEALNYLGLHRDGNYVDCTIGLGGHAERILHSLSDKGWLLGIDRDASALERVRKRLASRKSSLVLRHDNFKNLAAILASLGKRELDGCLVDLGVSSLQLKSPERGFSFREPAPLDMRMDQSQSLTAEQLVNDLSEQELAELFKVYGEEPQARRISAAIVESRSKQRIVTTTELAELVVRVKAKQRASRIHPATLVFQSLRIKVNQELEGLGEFLKSTIDLLRQGGRLVVITFHSLEDRIVKRTFQLEAGRCICRRPITLCGCPRVEKIRILTKKPIAPAPAEVEGNSSARSAKLRAVERIGPA